VLITKHIIVFLHFSYKISNYLFIRQNLFYCLIVINKFDLSIKRYLTNSNVIQNSYLIRIRNYLEVLTVSIDYYLKLIRTLIEKFVIILLKLANRKKK